MYEWFCHVGRLFASLYINHDVKEVVIPQTVPPEQSLAGPLSEWTSPRIYVGTGHSEMWCRPTSEPPKVPRTQTHTAPVGESQ